MAERVWLTVDDGVVWHAASSHSPTPTSLVCCSPFDAGCSVFMDRPIFVPGYRQNAVLIASLLSSLRDEGRVFVCGPRFVPGVDPKQPPSSILRALSRYSGQSAASASGPRQIVKRDFPSYFLYYWYASVCGAAKADGTSPSLVDTTKLAMSFLPRHPVYPWLTFLGCDADEDVLTLLGFIGEPRWYRTAQKPNKLRLDSALKLSLDSCILLSQPGLLSPPLRSLLKITRSVCLSELPSCAWLQDVYLSKSGGSLGLLAAARALLKYIDAVWVAMTDRTSSPHQLFVPQHFFKDQQSVALYLDFLSGVCAKRK